MCSTLGGWTQRNSAEQHPLADDNVHLPKVRTTMVRACHPSIGIRNTGCSPVLWFPFLEKSMFNRGRAVDLPQLSGKDAQRSSRGRKTVKNGLNGSLPGFPAKEREDDIHFEKVDFPTIRRRNYQTNNTDAHLLSRSLATGYRSSLP